MPFLGFSRHTRLMPVVDAIRVRGKVTARREHLRAGRRPLPRLDQIKLETLRVDELRIAVRRNLVSFPSQVPVFERHDRPDLQRKIVQLYFILGWSCGTIAARYGMLRQRIGQVLNTWKKRAVETGYIQYIPPRTTMVFPDKAIEVFLTPVVCEISATGADAGELSGMPVWAHANEILMSPIQKSYDSRA